MSNQATDAKRIEETRQLATALQDAIGAATAAPEDQEAWKIVATLAGNIQRRTRLLAGLGRGG